MFNFIVIGSNNFISMKRGEIIYYVYLIGYYSIYILKENILLLLNLEWLLDGLCFFIIFLCYLCFFLGFGK